MRILVCGAGRFGRVIAEEFITQRGLFADVALADFRKKALRNLPRGIRVASDISRESPDVLIVAASAVPSRVRKKLTSSTPLIRTLWQTERRFNLQLFKAIFPWIASCPWKLLVIATNPVDLWVNALHLALKNRAVVGIGSAFDDARIRFLAASMTPGREIQTISTLKIVGAHGNAIALNSKILPNGVLAVAKWMSDALSIRFIDAPYKYAKIWWRQVAIGPLVNGLAGKPTVTHLITPIKVAGVSAATSVAVQIKRLEIEPILSFQDLIAEDRNRLLKYLREMRALGQKLAFQITRQRQS